MKEKSYRFSTLLLIVIYFTSACGSEQTVTTPPVTATETATVTSSETSSSEGATLTGTVFLSNDNENPYPTSVELHLKHSLIVPHQLATDSAGIYTIDNIQPGDYEFWILITPDSLMVPGCSDVLPPNDTWLGIKFGNDRAVTLEENPSLSKAFDEARFMFEIDGSEAAGYYVIFPDLKIETGSEYKIDVVLICK